MSDDQVVPQKPIFDAERVQSAIRELLLGIGENPDREGLKDTPERVSRALQEIVGGLAQDPHETLTVTTFTENHNELVLLKDIPVYSLCEHHLLVFHGVAHVGYIPALNGKVAGLSKLAQLVDLYARRPQIQERLTSQIANAIVAKLEPRGVIVVIEAEHMCMAMRGIRKPGTKTVTSAVRGIFQSSPAARAEALSLISA